MKAFFERLFSTFSFFVDTQSSLCTQPQHKTMNQVQDDREKWKEETHISLRNAPEEIADHIAIFIKSWAEVGEDASDEEKVKGRK